MEIVNRIPTKPRAVSRSDSHEDTHILGSPTRADSIERDIGDDADTTKMPGGASYKNSVRRGFADGLTAGGAQTRSPVEASTSLPREILQSPRAVSRADSHEDFLSRADSHEAILSRADSHEDFLSRADSHEAILSRADSHEDTHILGSPTRADSIERDIGDDGDATGTTDAASSSMLGDGNGLAAESALSNIPVHAIPRGSPSSRTSRRTHSLESTNSGGSRDSFTIYSDTVGSCWLSPEVEVLFAHPLSLEAWKEALKYALGVDARKSRPHGDEDGGEEEDEALRAVMAHDEHVTDRFAPFSLCCLAKHNPLRVAAISIEVEPLFHHFIFLVILYNTILLGISDYGNIITDRDSPEVGQLDPHGSPRNWLIAKSEAPLAIVYICEAFIRVTAMGFWVYCADAWNLLDFVVSVSGIFELTNSDVGPVKLTFLRTFRVLRPLKFIKRLKELRVVVEAMLLSLPGLAAVVVLCLFFLTLFGIMAVQLYGGVLHSRCRMTPWPVTRDWTEGSDPEAFRCLVKGKAVPNFNVYADELNWGKSDSPWKDPQVGCFWPVDPDDERTCDLTNTRDVGSHVCVHNTRWVEKEDWRWCGSNFDARGNDRFGTQRPGSAGVFASYDDGSGEGGAVELKKRDVSSFAGTYAEAFNWGITSFDSSPAAFLSIFQICTEEGWAGLTYMVSDATGGTAAVFFVLLVVMGSFLILNLVLAVLETKFSLTKNRIKEEEIQKKEEAKEKLATRQHVIEKLKEENIDLDFVNIEIANQQEKVASASARLRRFASQISVQLGTFDTVSNSFVAGSNSFVAGDITSLSGQISVDSNQDEEQAAGGKKGEEEDFAAQWEARVGVFQKWFCTPPSAPWRTSLKPAMQSPLTEKFVLALILFNTGILAADRHPMNKTETDRLEFANFLLTLAFALEMTLKIVAEGLSWYLSDSDNKLDAVIVVASLAELGIAPPVVLGGERTTGGGAGFVTAFRALRLLRIFKMAKKWEAMNDLMTRGAHTVLDVTYVGMFMILCVFIFVLLGMQLFANLLKFDDFGYPIPIGKPGWAETESPRANFDTFAWAFVTVFQVFTGEDWNQVFYDCARASGSMATAVLFFVLMITVGMFIVLSMFLAILLSNFEYKKKSAPGDDQSEEESSEEGDKERANSLSLLPFVSPHQLCGEHNSKVNVSLTSLLPMAALPDTVAETSAGSFGSWIARSVGFDPVSLQVKFYPDANGVSMEPLDLRQCVLVRRRRETVTLHLQGSAKSVERIRFESEEKAVEWHDHLYQVAIRLYKDCDSPVLPQHRHHHIHHHPTTLTTPSTALATTTAAAAPGKILAPTPLLLPTRLPRVAFGSSAFGGSSGSLEITTLQEPVGPPPPHLGVAGGALIAFSGMSMPPPSPMGDSSGGGRRSFGSGGSSGSLYRDTLTEHELDQADRISDMDSGVWPLDPGRTLGLFTPDNPLRIACASLAATQEFETATMFVILLSSISLALETPWYAPDSTISIVLKRSDQVFVWYFLAEFVVKVVAFGLWFLPRAYLRDGFNVLDSIIVVYGIFDVIFSEADEFRAFRALRALRALRPLRVIKRFKSLKLCVNSLLNVIPDVGNVMLLCLLFFLVFAIVFIQSFKGQFMACQGAVFEDDISGTAKENFLVNPKPWDTLADDEKDWFYVATTTTTTEGGGGGGDAVCSDWPHGDKKVAWTRALPTSKDVCLCLGAKWEETVPQNFDNVVNAIATLLELSTTEGWVSVMHAAVDARGIDSQPVRNHSISWAFAFVLYMIIGPFFFVNLFCGVLYQRFVTAQSEAAGKAFLTSEQEEYITAQRLSIRFNPMRRLQPPAYGFRRRLFHAVTHESFEVFIMVCIVVNSFVMASQYFGQGDDYGAALEQMNFVFAMVFSGEAVLKLLALGRVQYFKIGWNCFDFAIVVGTLLGMAGQAGGGGGFVVILRAFRLARIVRVINGADALKDIINTMLFTLIGLMNVMALLLLLFFTYTVLGIQLFALVQYQGELNEHANFRSFGLSMLTLFRFSTGENWNGFMYDVASAGRREGKAAGDDEDDDDPTYCVDTPAYDKEMCGFTNRPGCVELNGCGTSAIYFYLYSFCVTVTFVTLNLFVGVIIDAFKDAAMRSAIFKPSDMEKFQLTWSHYDEDGTAFIDCTNLMHMVQHMPEPWGFGKDSKANRHDVRERIESLKLPIYQPDNSVFYYDMFFALSGSVILEEQRKKKLEALKVREDAQIEAEKKERMKLAAQNRLIEKAEKRTAERKRRASFDGERSAGRMSFGGGSAERQKPKRPDSYRVERKGQGFSSSIGSSSEAVAHHRGGGDFKDGSKDGHFNKFGDFKEDEEEEEKDEGEALAMSMVAAQKTTKKVRTEESVGEKTLSWQMSSEEEEENGGYSEETLRQYVHRSSSDEFDLVVALANKSAFALPPHPPLPPNRSPTSNGGGGGVDNRSKNGRWAHGIFFGEAESGSDDSDSDEDGDEDRLGTLDGIAMVSLASERSLAAAASTAAKAAKKGSSTKALAAMSLPERRAFYISQEQQQQGVVGGERGNLDGLAGRCMDGKVEANNGDGSREMDHAAVMSSMLTGKAGLMFRKMKRAAKKLCKRDAVKDAKGRSMTATEEYAARDIQRCWALFKIKKHAAATGTSQVAALLKHCLSDWRDDAAIGGGMRGLDEDILS